MGSHRRGSERRRRTSLNERKKKVPGRKFENLPMVSIGSAQLRMRFAPQHRDLK